MGRLVEQVWGRDGGRKLLIIAKQPTLLQALEMRCRIGGANPRDPALEGGAACSFPGACVCGEGDWRHRVSLSDLRHVLASLPPIKPYQEGSANGKRRQERAYSVPSEGVSL